MPISPLYQSEIIQDWQRFRTLKNEWNKLLWDSRADTLFLTWEWIISWVDIMADLIQPFVVIIRSANNSLIGIAPYYCSKYHFLKTIPFRTLRPLADYATGFEYPNWIVHKEKENAAIEGIVEALLSCRNQWDCIWMASMAGWNGRHQMLLQALKKTDFYCHSRSMEFSYFPLPGDMETYMGNFSGNRRDQLKRQIRKVVERKGVTVARCRTHDELPGFLDALFNLHHIRRKIKGDEGTFKRKPVQKQFYKMFTSLALDRGWLRFYILQEKGECKAVQIGYVYNKIFHQLQEGFDPEYIPGVGNVLRYKVIKSLIEEGVKEYDFLGEHTEHKRRWQANMREGYDLFMGRRNIKNALLFSKEIWPTGRYLRPVNPQSLTPDP